PAKVVLVCSVADLGNESGSAALRRTCENLSLAAPIFGCARLATYGTLVKSTVTMRLCSWPLPLRMQTHAQALYLLVGTNSLQKHDVRNIREVVRKALRDEAVGVRLVASNTIARIGDPSDGQFLEAAV